MDLKLAVFTVQTYDLQPEEAAAELRRLGYDGVEWRITGLPAEIPANRNFWNGNVCAFEITDLAHQVERIRALSAESHLALPTLGTYLAPTQLELLESCLKAARDLAVPMLRVGLPGWDRSCGYNDALQAAVAAWQPVVELARGYGVRVLAELHHGSLIPSASAARRFLENFSATEVGAIYDPGNMIHEGWEHPDIAIGTLGEYLAHVHVKNARWILKDGHWRGEMCRLDDGQVVWRDILAALRRWGYDGWYATEDFGPGDTREKLAANLTRLRELATEI